MVFPASPVAAKVHASVKLCGERLLPGQAVRFAAVTVEEAEKLRRDQEARLQRAIAGLVVARPAGGIDLVKLYEENLIGGVIYDRLSD